MRVVLIALVAVISIPASLYVFWIVHRTLDRVCVSHARRFCRRSGLHIQRVRWRPQFDSSGIKTESTLVQLDCVDCERQRRLLLVSVWLFGVREMISDQEYPDSYDTEWPQSAA